MNGCNRPLQKLHHKSSLILCNNRTVGKKCRRSPTVKVNGFSSIYLTVGAVRKRVRAPQTSSGIDCTQAKALVQGDCYEDLGNKADIIGRLITTWKAACGASPEPCATAIDATVNQPAFNEIRSWTKDLSPLTEFTFMQLYHYLVNCKDNTFKAVSPTDSFSVQLKTSRPSAATSISLFSSHNFALFALLSALMLSTADVRTLLLLS